MLLCGSGLAVEQTATYNGEHTGDQFGMSVSDAGDVDGDTFVDLLIGASLEDIRFGQAALCGATHYLPVWGVVRPV
jgi:hypothetical protein